MNKNFYKGVVLLLAALALGMSLVLIFRPVSEARSAFVWSALSGTSVNGPVYAMAYDSTSGHLYIGGSFTTIFTEGNGGKIISVNVQNFARWDGSTWAAVCNTSGTVYSLAVNVPGSGSVIAGGDFSGLYVATEDNGTYWCSNRAVFGSTNGSIYAIVRTGSGKLCIGGDFTVVQDTTAVGHVACQGASVGTIDMLDGGVDALVSDMALDGNGSLIVAGRFLHTSSGLSAKTIVRRNLATGTWETLGGGLGGAGIDGGGARVMAVAVGNDNDIYAGHTFTDLFGWGHPSVMRWDGDAWQRLTPDDWSLDVVTLAWDGRHNLYAGGETSSVVRYDGHTWALVGSGTNGSVNDIVLLPQYGAGYAGGNFTLAGGQTINRLAHFYDPGLGATETVQAGVTQTAGVRSTQTAIAAPTQTSAAALTQTAQAGGATQTAWAATQTANAPTPTPGPLYLPIAMRKFSPCTGMVIDEAEPNDIIGDANPVCLGATVRGKHDGAAGTGDLFKLWLGAGQQFRAGLETDSGAGVQLLLYREENGSYVQVLQDTNSPFILDYPVPASGWYLAYVYSDKSANNTAGYEMGLTDAGLR